ncbi:unnamed protein product [Schistosoma curassoni]|uniref:Uncharacterized protein n=1 Tax=Schistosoma curassoni TaxID=6186 RepID=A0A3P8KNJ9_9TREM|nr:unnamed protein product [Schistosoma curassoni]
MGTFRCLWSHKTDHIPELSPHYSETHSDDQLGGNTYRMDLLLELELAKVRLAQTEREIELERLRKKGREHYNQVMVDKAMTYESTSVSHVVDVPPRKDWILNIPAIKGTDPYNLKRLSREMHICELTLTQMNYVSDLNSTKTIECMFLKLPLHLQREWVKVACRVLKTGKEPSFKDLCEFAKEQSDIANTRYGLLVTGDPFNRNQKQSVANTKGHLDSAYKASVIR